jgi:hypothetical protein
MTQSTYEPDEGAGLRSTTPAASPLQRPNPRRNTARGASKAEAPSRLDPASRQYRAFGACTFAANGRVIAGVSGKYAAQPDPRISGHVSGCLAAGRDSSFEPPERVRSRQSHHRPLGDLGEARPRGRRLPL